MWRFSRCVPEKKGSREPAWTHLLFLTILLVYKIDNLFHLLFLLPHLCFCSVQHFYLDWMWQFVSLSFFFFEVKMSKQVWESKNNKVDGWKTSFQALFLIETILTWCSVAETGPRLVQTWHKALHCIAIFANHNYLSGKLYLFHLVISMSYISTG